MLNFWKKKKSEQGDENTPQEADNTPQTSGELSWDAQATQALEQSVAQAPVPGMMKNKVKKELSKAAEEAARKAGHTTVTAEDLMNGMLSKMPANMRQKIEKAAESGPEGLKNLENELRGKK